MDLLGFAVLLVDDDFNEARDTQQALQHAGAKVIGPFGDGDAALRSIAARPLNCAVIDVEPNEGTRFGVASALREKGVPCVFLTGFDPPQIPKELADVPIVRKPIDYRSLLGVVARLSVKLTA